MQVNTSPKHSPRLLSALSAICHPALACLPAVSNAAHLFPAGSPNKHQTFCAHLPVGGGHGRRPQHRTQGILLVGHTFAHAHFPSTLPNTQLSLSSLFVSLRPVDQHRSLPPLAHPTSRHPRCARQPQNRQHAVQPHLPTSLESTLLGAPSSKAFPSWC